jgi:transcriptional regulator
MYKLPNFTENDEQKVIHFMKENAFAIITGLGENFPAASHIPLEVEEKEGKLFFRGHMMRKTDHQLAFEKNNKVLVIFNGPHCYVSAKWYSNPQTASTWNYLTVHARGKIIFTDDDGTYHAIKAITNKYEGTETAAAFNQLPKEYVRPMLKAIIGFTIEVESIDNVFKLSQNKTKVEQINIIKHLKETGLENSIAIANEMEKRL